MRRFSCYALIGLRGFFFLTYDDWPLLQTTGLIKLVIECLISWKTLPIISELLIISCDSSDLVP